MTYRYRPEILALLASHGLRPKPDTAPDVPHEVVNDLYSYELRRLRADLLRGAFEKRTYADRVRAIRRRYPVLSVPLSDWVERS